MAHPNKAKGDRGEHEVLKLVTTVFPKAKRTRPGRREDEGDILTDEFTIQVKNVKTARWEAWLGEWDEQQKRSGKPYKILVWKRAGAGARPPRYLAVMDLHELLNFSQKCKDDGSREERGRP